MIKKILFLMISCVWMFGATSSVREFSWPSGMSFLTFLEKNELPLSLYYNLDKEDQELATEISSGTSCDMLFDENGKMQQVLIPIGEELQIHLYRNKRGSFELSFDPIVYFVERNTVTLKLENSPYMDIVKATGNNALADAFMGVFKSGINFSRLQKGDELVIIYTQKIRLGRVFGLPQIEAAMLEYKGVQNSLYFYDNKYYDKNGKDLSSFLLVAPMNAKITSYFTFKRYHPILHRYRAHLGVDYGAPRGSEIKAAGDGTVSFVGRKGGYGNVMEVTHGGGYMTLYAHVKGFAKGIKRGMRVKQGQIVAYVGTSGMATGPHLHFGVYKNSKPIDPLSVIKNSALKVISKEEAEFKKLVSKYDKEIAKASKEGMKPPKYENYDQAIDF